jgi:hypothetical protein
MRSKFQFAVEKVPHATRSFSEDLVSVPIRHTHNPRGLDDEFVGHVILKQITHRIDENHPRANPFEWLSKFLGHELYIEAVLIRMAWDAPEPFRKRLRIAMFATWADLFAPPHGVPCRVGPFYFGIITHGEQTAKL